RAESPLRLAVVFWKGLVLWFSYNRHEYYGPQTFQFDHRFRSPDRREENVIFCAALLATAVTCACVDAPRFDLEVVYRGEGIGTADTATTPGVKKELPAAVTLRPHEKTFLEQLPPKEREKYLQQVQARSLAATPAEKTPATSRLSFGWLRAFFFV